MNVMKGRIQAALVLAGVVLVSTALAGQNPPPAGNGDAPRTAAEAQALVRTAIHNQLEEDARPGGPAFRYTLRTNGKRGVLTQEMIETKDGIVARLVAINDRPPSPDERKADDDKLIGLLNDPQARQQKLKAQQEDDKRTRKMVGAIPDAFLFEPDGMADGPKGPLVRMKFNPNPKYNPPSRELQVFQGMSGTMLIDPRAKRLAEIDGKLFRDVNFGWGILGHLDKGGTFIVRQADVTGDGNWQVTEMKLNFDGKAIIFKSIHIRDDDRASNFHVVPNNLTFAQGVELLKRQESSAVAEKK
jgi:hypothetical protein